ncbi:MAG: hypothetical protein IT332_06390 [Ardenticatenales bacterium]|nr:hypothetical protein [Ardenticatenales bacterium]
MSAAWLIAALALAALAVGLAWVAMPLWFGAPAATADDPRVVGLLVEREAVLAGLRDLDDDRNDGRIDADDHRAQRDEAVARGAAVLAALDGLAAHHAGDAEADAAAIEADVRRRRARSADAP